MSTSTVWFITSGGQGRTLLENGAVGTPSEPGGLGRRLRDSPVKTLLGLPSVAAFWGLQPSCRKNRRSCSPVTDPCHCALLSLSGWCWGPTRGSSAPCDPFRWLCFGLKERKRIRMLGKQSDVSCFHTGHINNCDLKWASSIFPFLTGGFRLPPSHCLPLRPD